MLTEDRFLEVGVLVLEGGSVICFLTVSATLSGSSQLTRVNMSDWFASDVLSSPAIRIFLSHNENHIAGLFSFHGGSLSLVRSVGMTFWSAFEAPLSSSDIGGFVARELAGAVSRSLPFFLSWSG